MATFYNDSSFGTNYGTAYLLLSGNGFTGYALAENLTINQPSTKIELRNFLNEPAGKINLPDFEAGNASLQVSGAFPALGAQFAFQGTTYYLDEVGKQFALGDIYKAGVNFAKKYN